MVGACLEVRVSFFFFAEESLSFDFSPSFCRFCSRISWIRARTSSKGLVEDSRGLEDARTFFFFFGPRDSCALASAPKEMLLSEAWMSSLGSSSSSLSSSLFSGFSGLVDCKRHVSVRYVGCDPVERETDVV